MDHVKYRQYLEDLVREALANGDGTNSGIAQYLWSKKEAGRFSFNRDEKNRALSEARNAFDEHRHWPLSIVVSHLGIEDKELAKRAVDTGTDE